MRRRLERPRFVGRDQELQQLQAALCAAAAGQGGVAFVAGEPGMGKTRLVGEFIQAVQRDGWLVAQGAAYDSTGMPPYLPITNALRDYIRAAPLDVLRDHLAASGPEVARMAADLRRRVPDLAEEPAVTPAEQRYRLFESVSDFLLAMAVGVETKGLVLILDDLHWADASTLLLVEHLARRLAHAPALLVCAYRPEEVSRDYPLASVLANLRREGLAERLLLGPLTMAESAELVEALAGAVPAASVLEVIERQAEGNPLFITELVSELASDGHDLTRPDTAAAALAVPESVRELTERHLVRLSAAANRVLHMAAVLGDGFTLEELSAALGEHPESVLAALEEALAAGMLHEDDTAYQFSHALVRQAVQSSLSGARSQQLHRRVAEGLERVHARSLARYLAAIALHYRAAGSAGDAAKAIEYSARAGGQAEAVFAYEEALAHWQAALALMETAGVEPERRADLLKQLGDLAFVLGYGREPLAVEYREQALKLYEHLGLTERAAELHCLLAEVLSSGNPATQDLAAALAHYRAAEPVLEAVPPSAERVRLLAVWGDLSYLTLHTVEGLEQTGRIIELAKRSDDDWSWLLVASSRALLLAFAGRLQEAWALLERAHEAAVHQDQIRPGYRVALWGSVLGNVLDDPGRVREWVCREAGLPRQQRVPNRQQMLLAIASSCCLLNGEVPEAERLQHQAGEAVFESSVLSFWQPLAAFWAGDWEQAERLWTHAYEVKRRDGNRLAQVMFGFWLARVSCLRGSISSAEGILQETLTIAVDGPILPREAAIRASLALLLTDLGRSREAVLHLQRCRQILSNGEDWRGVAGRVALADAAAAATSADVIEAMRYFADAQMIFQRHGLLWEEAEALHRWGRALLASHECAPALAKLDAAIELYRGHGAGGVWVERVLADRRRAEAGLGADRRPAKPPPPTYPDGLSQREVEVLRLLAAGKTNQAIADELVLSLNTIARHVSNLYAKARAANRAEATSYAHRHGLV